MQRWMIQIEVRQSFPLVGHINLSVGIVSVTKNTGAAASCTGFTLFSFDRVICI